MDNVQSINGNNNAKILTPIGEITAIWQICIDNSNAIFSFGDDINLRICNGEFDYACMADCMQWISKWEETTNKK